MWLAALKAGAAAAREVRGASGCLVLVPPAQEVPGGGKFARLDDLSFAVAADEESTVSVVYLLLREMVALVAARQHGGDEVDLAKVEGSAVEFLELKIGSDNPFYAAMELAAYALMWVQARADADGQNHFGYRNDGKRRQALDFDHVRWTVLAPQTTVDFRVYETREVLTPL